MTSKKKLAIVSDRLLDCIGGAESILFTAHELYPDAPVYFTVYDEKIIPKEYQNIDIKATFIQNLPFAIKLYKAYFPLMPLAIEYLNLQEYDIIFSSHHCAAKGIITRPDAVHICYCHSPARYIWDLFWTYSDLIGFGEFKKFIVAVLSHYIRIWDVASANRVDHFLANSNYTAARIRKFYNRNAEVLYPPVNTEKFSYHGTDDYYLMAGRLVAYKGYELAIDAFNESGKRLVIIGDGTEYKRLKARTMPNIEMPGRVSDEILIKYMNNCKGFIFPGKEDFGIVMAEAQSAGKPVMAFKAGGALDIIEDNETGILFDEQNIRSLNNAVMKSEHTNWSHKDISEHSKKFDKKVFRNKLQYLLENAESLQEINRNTSIFNTGI